MCVDNPITLGFSASAASTMWNGSAVVHGKKLVEAPMAHAASLGKMVVDLGLCEAIPDLIFKFTISPRCLLRVTTDQAKTDHKVRSSQIPEHKEISTIPAYINEGLIQRSRARRFTVFRQSCRFLILPGPFPIKNGLYFFYEGTELFKPDPWEYAIHQCMSASNMYSRVHGAHFPHGMIGERFSGQIIQLSKQEHDEIFSDEKPTKKAHLN